MSAQRKDPVDRPIDVIRSVEDAEEMMDRVRDSASYAKNRLIEHVGEPLDMLKSMKFDRVGRHPTTGRDLNIIEQINQTWTYAVAIAAVRQLLELHPDADGFQLAPGAHAALPLDIMSLREGLVGAEIFAAVNPRNNKKLAGDLAKLADRTEKHRYVFFTSPDYPQQKWPTLEQDRTQVWSVTF